MSLRPFWWGSLLSGALAFFAGAFLAAFLAATFLSAFLVVGFLAIMTEFFRVYI